MPSLHRASIDALIIYIFKLQENEERGDDRSVTEERNEQGVVS